MKNLVRLTAVLMLALTLGALFAPKSVFAAQEAEEMSSTQKAIRLR